MKNKKGFTLIELLAVIIILGILMLIAIPSVTAYINNSRKSAYLDTIQEIVKGAMIKVNEGEVAVYDGDATYYMPYTCVKTENGTPKSPYGAFEEAYVGITYNGDSYDYYFVGRDKANMGVSELTYSGTMTKDHIVSNVTSIDTGVGIEGRTNVIIIDEDCITKSEPTAATSTVEGSGNAYTGGSGGGSGSSGKCNFTENQVFDFDYTGEVQEFKAKCQGNYKLEVWGAQGGPTTGSYPGAYGGYSIGTYNVSSSSTLYVVVGGAGTVSTGGYNGGGSGRTDTNSGGGGGATHIATSTGILSSLSSKQSDVLIVAGGGGGSRSTSMSYGSGGGYVGNGAGYYQSSSPGGSGGGGGTQTAGGILGNNTSGLGIGSFGQGGAWDSSNHGNANCNGGSGGGGGWYGGGSGSYPTGCDVSGAGGSGYIGNSLLTSKEMYCYRCVSSSDATTKTTSTTSYSETATANYAKQGNGFARITYLGK